MSLQVVEAYLRLKKIKPQHKLILLILAYHCPQGSDFVVVTQSRIALDTGLGVQSVKRFLTQMKNLGLIEIDRECKRAGVNGYKLKHIADQGGKSGVELALERFDVFWKFYPKKEAKSPALKAWMKRQPDDATLDQMLNYLDQRCRQDWDEANRKFIPLPATFINQERWLDEIDGAQERVCEQHRYL